VTLVVTVHIRNLNYYYYSLNSFLISSLFLITCSIHCLFNINRQYQVNSLNQHQLIICIATSINQTYSPATVAVLSFKAVCKVPSENNKFHLLSKNLPFIGVFPILGLLLQFFLVFDSQQFYTNYHCGMNLDWVLQY